MTDEKRVLLLKPGDTLLIGNVGDLPAEVFNEVTGALAVLREHVGVVDVVLFERDISIDSIPAAS